MIDGTVYWWPFIGIVVILWVILAIADPFSKK